MAISGFKMSQKKSENLTVCSLFFIQYILLLTISKIRILRFNKFYKELLMNVVNY